MWEDILKVQVLGSKQKVKQGIKPLPKAEKNDCIKWLKGLYDLFEKFQAADLGHPYAHIKGSKNNSVDWDKIPEHVACKIKHYLETQPYLNIDSEHHTNNKGVDLFSDNVVSIIIYFMDYIEVGIHININDIQVLSMDINANWMEIWDLTNGEMNDAIKAICKYINRRDVYEKYFIDWLDLASEEHPEYAGLYNSWLDEGKLDW